MRRPMIEIAVLSGLTIQIIFRIGSKLWTWPGVMISGLAFLLIAVVCLTISMVAQREHSKQDLRLIALFVISIMLVFYMTSLRQYKLEQASQVEGTCQLTGIVQSVTKKGFILHSVATDQIVLSSKVKVTVKRGLNTDVHIGEVVECEGVFQPIESARNPGVFDPKIYYAGKGIDLAATVWRVESTDIKRAGQISFGTKCIYQSVFVIRNWMERHIIAFFEPQDANLVMSILFGETDYLDDDLLEAFRTSGVAHILAVSGLHFGIIYMLVYQITTIIQIPYKVRVGVSLCVMFVFVFLAGVTFSALRAFSMLFLYSLAFYMNRRYDLLNALGTVAFGSMLYEPMVVFQVGFQLSFFAVLAIGIYTVVRPKRLTSVHDIFLLPLFLQLVLMPISIYHFNQLNVYSYFFNLPVLVLIGPLLILTVLAIGLGGLLSPLFGTMSGVVIAFPATCFLEVLRSLVLIVQRLPGHKMILGSFSLLGLLGIYGSLFLIGLVPASRQWKVIMTLAILSLLCIVIKPSSAGMIDFLDIGQGDAILIHGKGGTAILVDSGPKKKYLSDILLKQGITKLDAVFLTHPDADHCSGFLEIAESIEIENFYHGRIDYKKDVLESLKTAYPNTNFMMLETGQTVKWQDMTFDILLPDDKQGEDVNNMSLVMLLRYKKWRVLLTGDIEAPIETDFVNRYPNLDVDVLKAAHHGANTSSTKAFVEGVSPEITVIQVGKNNYGHPADQTLERLEDIHSQVFRNDKMGCIRIKLGSEKITCIPWLRQYETITLQQGHGMVQ